MANHAVVQRFMADGPPVERQLMARETSRKVNELVRSSPQGDYRTVRRLLAEARSGKVDPEVFKEYVRRTGSISLVQEIKDFEDYQRR